MAVQAREEQIRVHTERAAQRLSVAGQTLALRQSATGPARGNVSPWPGCEDLDFHGTLASIWIWQRAQDLAQNNVFVAHVAAGWRFVKALWPRFIPSALGGPASEEAAYDCAMVLRAAAVERVGSGTPESRELAGLASRLLAAHLGELEDFGGRAFRDPGFLAWSMADYARAAGDRGLLAAARGFVERAFGLKGIPQITAEPSAKDGLFDFSSTTATRLQAVLASEGSTPFTGAWLRERAAVAVPDGFTSRPRDENCWNACVASALGRSFVVSTDVRFLRAHQAIMSRLDARVGAMSGTVGRQPGFEDETLATFYYSLALDSMVRG